MALVPVSTSLSLDGSNGFVINGIDAGDYSGDSVSSAGDINGDGFDDLIIGALSADPNGQSGAGSELRGVWQQQWLWMPVSTSRPWMAATAL